MPAYDAVLPPSSDFWKKCARHTNPTTSKNLAYIYLCDVCLERLVAEALNERPPIYHGETRRGYCGLCNELKTVTFRQWFACAICWNVVVAYQKGIVASEAVHRFWAERIGHTSGF